MGPAGADGNDGADGKDGADGNVTCLSCHSGTNMESKAAEFAMSVHSSGAIAVDYAGGRQSCARCHSHEGFTQFTVFNAVLGDITNPSAWECGTCHGLHKSFESKDYALRATLPVIAVSDGTILDLKGNSNLCGTCHQSREKEPNKAIPGETFRITSPYYGPHYSTQANILLGVGLAEIPGAVAYPAPNSGKHLTQASCVGCHMAPFSKKQGGHTFNPNLDACNSCHGATDTNFNYGGVQTEVEQLLEQLTEILVELKVIQYDEGSAHHAPIVGTYPMIQAQAFFNWKGIKEDRSLGVHNPKYVKALLQNSIKALE